LLELIDDGKKGTVGMVRGALVAHRDMRLINDGIQECLADPRLANAGFAAQQRDLTRATLCLVPKIQ
jgi:hypothetical protein